ncbi:hypothetical protein [Thalassobacillus hwangdonensis]|uniref:Uncharacterized protein n=1 Tax=Thalassobacillus hwangdonensis TaxID=546108 RepID=A0ABW3L6H8_9BACI
MKLLKSKPFYFFLIIILSGIFFFNYGTPWDLYKYDKAFEEHLESNYDGDFVVKNINYDIIHQTYHAKAYERENPELIFYVGQNISDQKITDSYDFEKMHVDAKEKVQSVLDQHLSDFTVNVEVVSMKDKELEINIWTEEEIDQEMEETLLQAVLKETEYTSNQFFVSAKR